MSSKIHNRIDDYVERNSFRVAGSLPTDTRDESRSTPQKKKLNTLSSSKKEKTLKDSREKNKQSVKSIAIIKE